MKTEFDLHKRDCIKCDFTMECNVKHYSFLPATVDALKSFDDAETMEITEIVAISTGTDCFEEIQKKVKTKKIEFIGWGFCGRSAGWYVIECNGVKPYPNSPVAEQVKSIVEKHYKTFEKRIINLIDNLKKPNY